MNMKKTAEITPTHKVGIKLFSEFQMKNIFPDYQNLLNRIESHRKNIATLEPIPKDHYQYNLMYDNVFTILGKRGSGKTSVAFTLQKFFEDNTNHPCDIVMPIIIPDVIPADCSILGWMLAIIKQAIQNFEKESEDLMAMEDFRENDYWANCRYSSHSAQGDLLKKVNQLLEMYYANKYDPSHENSFHVAVGNSARQTQDYYQFSQLMAELWNEWINAIKKRQSYLYLKDKCAQEAPLIYFIFDDVDLAPEKVGELLAIIIKYLSHPNVIVLTTADEELFLEVTENNFDRNIGRLPKEWRNYLHKNAIEQESFQYIDKDELDLIQQTARMYLGKVLPTSTRYYLNLFMDAGHKARFLINDKRLDLCIEELIEKLLEKYNGEGRNINSFLKAENRMINFYFNFLGDTSRQIANAYYGIQEFIETLADCCQFQKEHTEEYWMRIFYASRYFLQISVSSNHCLAENIENRERFVYEILPFRYNGWNLYINYQYLTNFLLHHPLKEKRKTFSQWVQMAQGLFSLLLFLENIFYIVDSIPEHNSSKRKKIYGISYYTNFVSETFFQGAHMFRSSLTANDFFIHYEKLLNQLQYGAEFRENIKQKNIEYFHALLDAPYAGQKLTVEELEKLYQADREWFCDISAALALVYGKVYLIERKEAKACQIYASDNLLSRYQIRIQNILEDGFFHCFDRLDLSAQAELEIKVAHEVKSNGYQQKKSLNRYLKWIQKELINLYNPQNPFDREPDQPLQTDTYFDQQSHTYCPMSAVVRLTEEFCRKISFPSLLDLCQNLHIYTAVRIGERLKDEYLTSEDILEILESLYAYIENQDNNFKELYIENLRDLYNNFLLLWDLTDHDIHIKEILDKLSLAVEGNLSINNNKNALYKQIKLVLRQVSEYFEHFYDDAEESAIFITIQEILQNIDIAVDLELIPSIESAVHLALEVQLAKKLQALYLYQIILERRTGRYPLSSQVLNWYQGQQNSGKKSYYYSLFLAVDDLLKSHQDDERAFMQTAVRNAVKRKKDGYILELLKGNENESLSY